MRTPCRSHTLPASSCASLVTKQDPDGEQYNEQQEVTCRATGGYFTLTYRGFTTKLISFDASAQDIVDAIQPLPSLYGLYDNAVSVQFSSSETQACTPEGHSWTVEFLHDFGHVPLFVPGVSKLTHSTFGITPSVTVDEMLQGTKESKVCSGRGLCDATDGVCQCEVEFDSSNGYNEEVSEPGRLHVDFLREAFHQEAAPAIHNNYHCSIVLFRGPSRLWISLGSGIIVLFSNTETLIGTP